MITAREQLIMKMQSDINTYGKVAVLEIIERSSDARKRARLRKLYYSILEHRG